MSERDLEVVIMVFAEGAQELGRIEMGKMMRDDGIWERNRDRIDPEVEVRFVTPGDQGVQVMEQEFKGIEGLREGWAVWMEPWEEFWIEVDDYVDAGNGQVLALATATGRMRGTGAELPQEVAALARVEEGRIASVGFYLDQQQARRDAGLL
jgi:ketosteroid isomerase-like protein